MPRTARFYKSAGKSCAAGSEAPVGGRRHWHGSWSTRVREVHHDYLRNRDPRRHGGNAREAIVNRATGLVGAMLAGAGLMYLLDPDRGARRRALVRDQATSAQRRAIRTLQATFEDARSRASGTLAEAQQRWRGEDVPDGTLVERVRSRLGLVSSDPSAIEVTAREGCVTLRGVVGRAELAAIVRAAKWTRGVRLVDDQLEARDDNATEARPSATG